MAMGREKSNKRLVGNGLWLGNEKGFEDLGLGFVEGLGEEEEGKRRWGVSTLAVVEPMALAVGWFWWQNFSLIFIFFPL